MTPSVFGADDRTIIQNAGLNTYPASLAVRITVVWPDGYTHYGSGLLIGVEDVLTAAHVVYSAAHGGPATSITVTPSYNNGSGPYGSFSAISTTPFSEGWKDSSEISDLAIIRLNNPIGALLGWAGTDSLLNFEQPTKALAGFGFANDIANGEVMVRTTGTVDAEDSSLLLFRDDMDLSGGQSGSNLLSFDEAGYPVIQGVLLGYHYGNAGFWENFARSIDSDVAKWISDTTGNEFPWSTNPGAIANQIGRLYVGLFDRIPDPGGLNYWIDRADSDLRLEDIAMQFMYSKEFIEAHGSIGLIGDLDFLHLIYQTLLHRSPDEGGLNYWLGRMSQGLSQSSVVVEFSESQEAIENTTQMLAGIHPADGTNWLI